MAKANATGRNASMSKAQRQASFNPNNRPATPTPTLPAPTPANTAVAKVEAKVGKIEKRVDPNRGAVTRQRWSLVLKQFPGSKLVMPPDIKALPHSTVITALVPGNPKKRSAADRYELYGFNGKQGASLTIAELLRRLGQRHSHALAFADIAWDVNHRFISLSEVVDLDPPKEESEPVAALEHSPEPEAEKQPEPEPEPEPETKGETDFEAEAAKAAAQQSYEDYVGSEPEAATEAE